jgi:hypothetical protein
MLLHFADQGRIIVEVDIYSVIDFRKISAFEGKVHNRTDNAGHGAAKAAIASVF